MDVRPWLLVKCDSCYDEYNCHYPEGMRWSIPVDGGDAVPICENCWDGMYSINNPLPCDWSDLKPVTLTQAIDLERLNMRFSRNSIAFAMAALDGIELPEINSTVTSPDYVSIWREYLGKADDLLVMISATEPQHLAPER